MALFTKDDRLKQCSECLAGAVQTRLDGPRGDSQLPRRLFGVEFFNVAEDENLSVRMGQPVDARPDVGGVSARVSRARA